jgi:hypothetical protein
MNDLSAHLVDRVLPEVPVRHWILSLPYGLRYLLGYDRRLCAQVVTVFVKTVFRSLRTRAKHQLGLESVEQAHCGSVTAVQRADSALRLNVHLHCLVLDGVYVRDEMNGTLALHPLAEPTTEQVVSVASSTAEQVRRLLERRGSLQDDEGIDTDVLGLDQPTLASCYHASVLGRDVTGPRKGQPTLRLLGLPSSSDSAASGPQANVDGFSVHAKQRVDGRDRKQLERLCRYITRPPLAQDRLERLDDGRVRYTLKQRWSDGTVAIVLQPLDLLSRLCALVPPPRFHLLRLHGVLARHSSLRNEIVPSKIAPKVVAATDPSTVQDDDVPRALGPGRMPWAALLKRTFSEDVLQCPDCQGRLTLKHFATEPKAIARLLRRHGIDPTAPKVHPARAPPQSEFEFDTEPA